MSTVSGSRVCVVGGAGFLGSHLVEHLVSLDCDVLVLDNLSVGRKDFIPDGVKFWGSSISTAHESNLRNMFRTYDIEYLFNYAAMPFIPDCVKNPVGVFETNTLGALKVMESAHKAGVKRILQVSSAEVYGNALAEQDELLEGQCEIDPISTYAISKASIDRLCQCRHTEVGLPVIVLRQFNCVGERETHPYVIPEIIDQVCKAKGFDGDNLTLRLGADTKRDFLYAGDAVAMAVELLEKGELGEVYNLGSENNISIYDLARLIAKLMRPECKVSIEQDESKLRPNDIWNLKSNNTEIYKVIDRRPTVHLREALQRTIDYYVANNHDWGW